ncbi:MAG TPA: BlaI/MecI/CopY family transcriptional regulator [Terriglobales bacterium]|nr:BlaI/MecI/CopY family transcriptional regulator [Terriglobales bacterium]
MKQRPQDQVSKQSAPGLGPLENRLLNLIWTRGTATVRELLEAGNVAGAYTTLMTTLDRLHKKGLLNRIPEGRAFRYSPAQTRDEFNSAIVRNAVQRMFSSPDSATMSHLVDALSEQNRDLLDELQREIDRKRRDLDGDHSE